MIPQMGVDTAGTQHKAANASKVWAITTAAVNTTVTLPAIAENYGNYIDVLKADAGAGYVTVAGNGAETINGVASIVIELQYCGLRLYGAASEWIVVGTIGECEIQTIGSAIEVVYAKYIDHTVGTPVNHDIDYAKIRHYDIMVTLSATEKYSKHPEFVLYCTSTQVNMISSGGTFTGKASVIILKYYI